MIRFYKNWQETGESGKNLKQHVISDAGRSEDCSSSTLTRLFPAQGVQFYKKQIPAILAEYRIEF